MGAAEGTKMDDDFVEMERVWKLNWMFYVCFFYEIKYNDKF